MSFAKGAFRSITGKIGKMAPKRFKLKTRTATMGIRGTQILFKTGGNKPDTMACTQGAITVTSDTGETVDVPAGQITTVTEGEAPTPPKAYEPEEIEALGEDAGGGGETVDGEAIAEENSDDSEEEGVEEEKSEEEEEKEEDEEGDKEESDEEKSEEDEEGDKEESEEEGTEEDKEDDGAKEESKEEGTEEDKEEAKEEKQADKEEKKQDKEDQKSEKSDESTENDEGTEETQDDSSEQQDEGSTKEGAQDENSDTQESENEGGETQSQDEPSNDESTGADDSGDTQGGDSEVGTKSEGSGESTDTGSDDSSGASTSTGESESSNDTGSSSGRSTETAPAEPTPEAPADDIPAEQPADVPSNDLPDAETPDADLGGDIGGDLGLGDDLGSSGLDSGVGDVGDVGDVVLGSGGAAADAFDVGVLEEASDTAQQQTNVAQQEQIEQEQEELLDEKKGAALEEIEQRPSGASFIAGAVAQSNAAELIDNDPFVDWGFWLVEGTTDVSNPDNISGAYTSGDLTPEAVLDRYMLENKTATYSGSVDGVIIGDTTSRMQDGAIELQFNFGEVNAVSGNMNFSDGSDKWSVDIGSGGVSNRGFTVGDFTKAADSAVNIESGSGSGRFYGPDVDAVGGTFSTTGDGKTASGIMIGAKQ